MNFRQSVSIIVFFSLLAGTHLLIYARNIGLKYNVTSLKVKAGELNSKNRSLGCRAAQVENLARIEKEAKEKLGMVYPEKINYLPGPKEKSNG